MALSIVGKGLPMRLIFIFWMLLLCINVRAVPGGTYLLTGKEKGFEEIVRADMEKFPEMYEGVHLKSYLQRFKKENKIGRRRFSPGEKLVFPSTIASLRMKKKETERRKKLQEKREKEKKERERKKEKIRRKRGYLWEVISVESKGTDWYNPPSGERYRAEVFMIKFALEEHDSYSISFFFEFKNQDGTLVPLRGSFFVPESKEKRWPFEIHTIYIPEEKYGLDQPTLTAYAVEILAAPSPEKKNITCVVGSKCFSCDAGGELSKKHESWETLRDYGSEIVTFYNY
jgi:hypothetical protein